jgi:hypothetical protein
MKALTQPTVDSGVTDGDVLIAFTDGIAGTDRSALGRARAALEERMGPNAMVESALTIANFSMLDRIANGIGIPVEEPFVKSTADFRADIGLNDFLSAPIIAASSSFPMKPSGSALALSTFSIMAA